MISYQEITVTLGDRENTVPLPLNSTVLDVRAEGGIPGLRVQVPKMDPEVLVDRLFLMTDRDIAAPRRALFIGLAAAGLMGYNVYEVASFTDVGELVSTRVEQALVGLHDAGEPSDVFVPVAELTP